MDAKSGAADRQAARDVIEAALSSGASALDGSQIGELFRAYGLALAEQTGSCEREFQVRLRRDPAFGPVVSFGLGGILATAISDVAAALAPVDDEAAAELPALIKSHVLLDQFGDRPAVDRTSLAGLIQQVGQMAIDNPEIVEIDADPVVIQGDKPVIVCGLVRLAPVAEAKKQDRRAFKPDMHALLAPRSVAIVGASGDVTKPGGAALRNILDGGYKGKVYPINPKGGVFFGVQSYLSIEDVPEPPDLALLGVEGRQIASLLDACVRKRVGAVVVPAAASSEAGQARSEAVIEMARAATMGAVTLLGPDCLGLVSGEVSLHALGSVALHPSRGSLSLVSQSGDLGVRIIEACERRGAGIEKFVGVGAQAQIGIAEILDYLRNDPRTSCVMVYMDALSDGRRFLEAARRTTAVKPVVVLRAGVSHEQSTAWEAAAREAAVVGCTSIEALVDLATCFSSVPLPRGRRVAVVSESGAAGILAADEMVRQGLVSAKLPAGVKDADLGGLKAVAECEGVDAVVLLTPVHNAILSEVADLMESTGKPMIVVPHSPSEAGLFDLGKKYRPVVLSSAGAAAQALDRMHWFASHRREHIPLA